MKRKERLAEEYLEKYGTVPYSVAQAAFLAGWNACREEAISKTNTSGYWTKAEMHFLLEQLGEEDGEG